MEGSISNELRLETFTSIVGEPFTVGEEVAATIELLLVEAKARGAGPQLSRPAFSLLFQGPPDPLLPQATYRFEHPSLGTMAIFIVPLGRDEHSAVYEAVFS